jgi:isochorismate synthase
VPAAETLDALLREAVTQLPNAGEWVCLSLSAPLAPAERLLAQSDAQDAVLWAPEAHDERAGVGAAAVLTAAGSDRFASVQSAASTLLGSVTRLPLGDAPLFAPLLFGGFAFREGSQPHGIWHHFGDARFVLPRIAYARRGDQAALMLTLRAAELALEPERLRLREEALAAYGALLVRPAATRPPEQLVLCDERESDWTELVRGIRAEIDAGRLEKVVAARRITLKGDALPSSSTVLERLRHEAPESRRFALCTQGGTFLGASPERLVKRSGQRVTTEAVAGSVRAGDDARIEQLLRSAKDGAEQAIVAREIRAALLPLCSSLEETGPLLYRLRHVAHLRTSFAGVLHGAPHVLELVERLHPTPAVGGTPRRAALEWIAEHEPTERGFYAGPFGAFDAHGDGEFVVALRSGLLAAHEAHLFAGAGIVGGSEAESELAETRWKLGALLAAIGVG